MSQLAIFGGAPVRSAPFPGYSVIGEEEKRAVMEVMDSGVLSRFLGCWDPDFYGGSKVREFEAAWAVQSQAKHAVAVNSCTSGLYAAVGALNIGPGDEVIVSPFTMVASATAALVFNAVPVFADIDPEIYTLSAETIAERITPRTKAIIVVHIFGQSADMDPIMALARRHGIAVIEDCAQVPFASYKGRPVGTLGDIGVFSLNYHKHIHTGEGGICVTNSDELADRLQLIRNHAEAVVEDKGTANLTNMIGFNFRLGEIEAAIGLSQLRKGPALIAQRKQNVQYLEARLVGIPGLAMPKVGPGGDHVYYQHVLDYDKERTGVSRESFAAAVKAELPPTLLREREGPLLGTGYVKPIYLLPMYQRVIGYGTVQCPFRCPLYGGKASYDAGLCPNAERAHQTRVITHEMIRSPMSKRDLDDVAAAFQKVADNLGELSDRVRTIA